MLLTFTQALQLVGLAPCLFLIVFLLSLAPRNSQSIIPVFYFAALACVFALPLVSLHPQLAAHRWLEGGLLLGESTLAAFSFLLICQFMTGSVPRPAYWLVLAIPLIGGSSLVYASVTGLGDACALDQTCPDLEGMIVLYRVFSSALIMLLLVIYASRVGHVSGEEGSRKHKYWLVVAMILLNLLVLAIDLARLSGHLSESDARFSSTVFELTFIYLVMTSLFRVFYPGMASQMTELVTGKAEYDPLLDAPHVEKIHALLGQERVYRQMRLNRAGMAALVGIGEYHLSRVINRHFGKNFNELINGFRIEEAKRRLKEEEAQITTIGFEVGFNSIASFNRVFRSKVGISPTEYRQRTGAEPNKE